MPTNAASSTTTAAISQTSSECVSVIPWNAEGYSRSADPYVSSFLSVDDAILSGMPHRPSTNAQGAPSDAEGRAPGSPGHGQYLKGKPIRYYRPAGHAGIRDLVDGGFQAFNAGRLSEACKIYADKMLA